MIIICRSILSAKPVHGLGPAADTNLAEWEGYALCAVNDLVASALLNQDLSTGPAHDE